MFDKIADLPDLATDRGKVRYFFPEGRERPFAKGGLPAAALIFSHFEPGAELSLRPLERVQALEQLLGNGSAVDLTGSYLREALGWLETVPCYSLHYGNLDAAIDRLNELWAEL